MISNDWSRSQWTDCSGRSDGRRWRRKARPLVGNLLSGCFKPPRPGRSQAGTPPPPPPPPHLLSLTPPPPPVAPPLCLLPLKHHTQIHTLTLHTSHINAGAGPGASRTNTRVTGHTHTHSVHHCICAWKSAAQIIHHTCLQLTIIQSIRASLLWLWYQAPPSAEVTGH